MEGQNQNMDSQNMAQEGQQLADQQSQQQAKTFTQEDVNRIVQERLARAKHLPDSAGYAEREEALSLRERQLDAREKLADDGLPKDLLPLVNCSSKEDMEKSISLISTYFKGAPAKAGERQSIYRMSSGVSTSSGGSHKEASDDEIREAMGLKGR